MKKKINVIDLDKTLIPYDSFRLLIKNELYNLDFYVLRLSLFRVLRIILPDKFKHKIVNHLSIKYDDVFFKNYVDRIFIDIDQEVMTLIEKEIDDNTINVLLSASPHLFVTYFIQKLEWVGSGSYIDNEGKFIHLYGQEKVNWLLDTYKKDSFIYNFAISDSPSDNQLLSLFKKNIKWTLR